MQSDRAAVRALLSGGDDVNAAQGDGMTALHWAARHGDVELIRMLLSAGANVRATTPRTGDAAGRETIDDVSGLPPLPTGGPGVPPIVAAAGTGFGEGFAGNAYRNAPSGFLPR